MTHSTFRQIFSPLCVALFFGLILTGCNLPKAAPASTQPAAAEAAGAAPSTPVATELPLGSPTPAILPAPTSTNPPPTSTSLAVIDITGNVTWHAQKELIRWSNDAGDGNLLYTPPQFVLYSDGWLYQADYDPVKPPFVSHLETDQVCKLLNTIEKSGFMNDSTNYRMPFSGASGSGFSVNTWRGSKQTHIQAFQGAINGATYYDPLYCHDCPIPSESTLIRPSLANLYFLLKQYVPEKKSVSPIERVNVTLSTVDAATKAELWPLTSISIEDFVKAKAAHCPDVGSDFSGEVAREIMAYTKDNGIYRSADGKTVIQISYRPVWPRDDSAAATGCISLTPTPDKPASVDDVLTCNTKDPTFPLLPLNADNQFWYYAPGGEWGAERIANENTMRVVNKLGYEQIYQIQPRLFGQSFIQIFPRYWSNDGQFFFVNVLPTDYQPNTSFVDSIGLLRIDVTHQSVSYAFIGTQKETFAHGFSNNGRYIAYIQQGERVLKLVVADSITRREYAGNIASPDLPEDAYIAAGSIVWSPKDDKIYFAATYIQDGQRKTHIFATDPIHPERMKVVYSADGDLKLRAEPFHFGSAEICPMLATGDDNCSKTLDLTTNEIK